MGVATSMASYMLELGGWFGGTKRTCDESKTHKLLSPFLMNI